MRSKRVLAILLPFIAGVAADRLLVESPVSAQVRSVPATSIPSLKVGEAMIMIGMSRREAMAALTRYAVNATNGVTSIYVKPSGRQGISGPTFLGTITFDTNDSVSEITRSWGDESGPEVERLWKSFWGAITNNIPVDQLYLPVYIRPSTHRSPQSLLETIDIRLNPNRAVSIDRFDSGSFRKSVFSVNEIVSSE